MVKIQMDHIWLFLCQLMLLLILSITMTEKWLQLCSDEGSSISLIALCGVEERGDANGEEINVCDSLKLVLSSGELER